jgi:hypothetical protein
MRRNKRLAVAVTLVLLASGAAILAAEAPAAGQIDSKQNVRITVRLGALEDGNRVPVKTYTLVVASGSVGSKLLAGERVPFPASIQEGGSAGSHDVKSFVYQNVGFVTEVRAWVLDKRKIMLYAEIEDSRVVKSTEGMPPKVETRQLSVNAVLDDGIPFELTRVEGVTDKSGFVEIEATILN